MKALYALAATASMLAFAPAAHAATFLPGSPEFRVAGPTDGSGSISAAISRIGLSGSGSDSFLFRIGPETDPAEFIGLGSGSITTSFTNSVDRLIFNSVTFSNGVTTFNVPIMATSTGGFAGSLTDIPIFSGVLNNLTVNYTAGSNSSFGGTLTFTPAVAGAVPEPGTWMMMILGFAAVGFAMRKQKAPEARVRYAF